ncbi:TatD family hydrolase [Rhodoferax saidenbachensis]|uniref:DNAase n=1 Tax=Rhodoferax saidenbachensis TaxID=1484693 RepID=A0A1P8K838_9BURK|nr:TatD family hydrolase [Rhodoferax saidenbachensis]APW42149.1 DNAase [Rhodoferax saidenbachensis]
MRWIDTHCHLDAWEFGPLAQEVRARAAIKGVAYCVIPAVEVGNFDAVRTLAHATGDSYCLGIHPLYVPRANPGDLALLEAELAARHSDPRLVGVGEIGLDYFVPALQQEPQRTQQENFYRAQLRLARQYGLPVVLHVRRSADRLLKHLRDLSRHGPAWTGIAHAFNGSEVQAQEFIRLGFKLGFGGAVTFERALQLRHLAKTLPLESIVLETDAPDIPPHWLYATAEQRAQGQPQGRNEPGELPRIAEVVAQLRGMPVEALAEATTQNACAALPRLGALLV